MRYVKYIALALFIISVSALADWPPEGVEVNPYFTGNVNDSPTMVPDMNGGAIYVWRDNTNGNILARRYDHMGCALWDPPTQANSEPGPIGFPLACSDGQKGIYVAWVQYTAPNRVWVARIDSMGILLWDTTACTIAREQKNPSLVGLMDAGLIHPVVVGTVKSLGIDNDIWVQKLHPDGTREWGVGGVGVDVCSNGSEQQNPVAVANGGKIIVVWEDDRNTNWDIFANMVRLDGSVLQTNGWEVCYDSSIQQKPQLVPDAGSGAMVAWEDNRSGNWDIYADRLDSTFMVWSGTGLGVPVCRSMGNQNEITVAKGPGNSAVVCWTDDMLGTKDIRAQRLDSAGRKWDTLGIMVCVAANNQQRPRIVGQSGEQKYAIIWEDFRNGNPDVFGQAIDNNQNFLWGSGQPVAVYAGFGDQTVPRLIRGNDTYLFAAWEDNRNGYGGKDIYGQRIFWGGGVGSVLAPELVTPTDMGTIGSTSVDFYWNPPAYPLGYSTTYRLQVAKDYDFTQMTYDLPDLNATQALGLSLADLTTYYWRVRAYIASPADSSCWSNIWSFDIDATVPQTPTLIAPANNTHTCSTSVTFDYQSTGATYYHIQIDNNQNFLSPFVNDSSWSMPNYYLDFVSQGDGDYFWRVRAGSAVPVWSGWSPAWRLVIDTQAPSVQSTSPQNGNSNVPVDAPIKVFFSEPVLRDSIQFTCNPDPSTWSIQQSGNEVDFYHNMPFQFNTSHLFTINKYCDSAGNYGQPLNLTFATIPLVDTVKPRLTVLSNSVDMVLGQPFAVEAYAKDEHTLNTVHLVYGLAGSGQTSDVAMQPVAGVDSLYRYVIQQNQINPRGMQYRIWAEDSVIGSKSNIRYYPDSVDFWVHAVKFAGGAYTTTYGSDKWYSLAVPGDYNNVSMYDMLADEMGTYDKTKWRLFKIQDQTPLEQETSGSGAISTGQALWLYQRVGAPDIGLGFQGVHQSIGDRLRSQPAQVPLVPGWSDVGSPMTYDVRWDTTLALSDTASVAGPYYYNGSNWEYPNQVVGSGVMTPYRGYAFKNNRSTAANLRIPILSASSKVGGGALWPEGWQVQVIARSGENLDNAYFGIGAGTAMGQDRWDFPEPPNGLVPVAGYFLLGEEKCAVDLRPELGQGQAWDYELASDGQVTLEISLPGNLPANTTCWLLDPVRQASFPVSNGFKYLYQPEPGEAERRFKLVVGGEDYVRAELAGAFGVPTATLMERGRPNPFGQVTTINYQLAAGGPVRISVYNVAGQLVRTLANRAQMAGRYLVRWDGRDDRGRQASNGVYFCRMQAGGTTATQRVMMVR